MKTATIIGNGLREVFRYRANWFFLFIFPMLLILVLGAAFGGSYTPKVGVVSVRSGALGADLVSRLEGTEGIDVVAVEDEEKLLDDVERGMLEAGVIVPAAYDGRIRAGDEVTLRFVARPEAFELRTTVAAAVAGQEAVLRAARFASDEGVATFDQALVVAEEAARDDPGIVVRERVIGEAVFPEDLGRFDVGASSELVLFVFLMSMMSGIALIEARRLGVIRRMLATPTRPRSILLGEGLSRVAVSVLQALVIMLGSALLFGVRWGNPFGAALIVLSFALAGAGAGLLVGSVLRTEQQAVATSLLLGLGLGALGGCMVPLDFFSDTMVAVAHVTPHAWALDAFADLVRDHAGVGDILPRIGVLLGFAAALLTVASWRLRAVITR